MPRLPSDSEIELGQTLLQLWNQGSHQQAIEMLRPLADRDERWAVNLMCWLTMQIGPPGIEHGLPYARKALALGMPWSATSFANNLVAHAAALPNLIEAVLELTTEVVPWPVGFDTAGQGWNLISQGQVAEGIRLMGVHGTFPYNSDQWASLIHAARNQVNELEQIVSAARNHQEQVDAFAEESNVAIQRSRDALETSAQQAGLLVTSVTSDSASSLFNKDAERNEGESKAAWRSGLLVLILAALVAILPLCLHYFGVGRDYSDAALIGAHGASAVALATVAGVLLARARSRDVARQRAGDLSTAMGTMIAYSNQIQDPSEKERFMLTMGQLVLQAHLTAGGSGSAANDESLPGLVALANLLRAPTNPTQAGS